ncbi:MAG TPA: hypothetical protein VFG79_24240 [Solirubrobacter sp.]|nr:hypothetical protein [Solirubrobacter sp.]
MPRLALSAAAAIAVALALASSASAAKGPTPVPADTPASGLQGTNQPSIGTPVSFTGGQLTPASRTFTTLLSPPPPSVEPDLDERNEMFARAMDIIRQSQSMFDRTIRGVS